MSKKPQSGKRKSGKADIPVPTREQVLTYIQENPDKATKRDIARAFGVTGANRIPLKHLLKDLAEEGLIEKRRGQTFLSKGELPSVTVLEVVSIDTDGEIKMRPTAWEADTPYPDIILAPGSGMGHGRTGRALGIGERALCRIAKKSDGIYVARVMRRLDREEGRILGVYEKVGRDGRIKPVDRRAKRDFGVREGDEAGAQTGDLVFAELMPRDGYGARLAKITQTLGSTEDPSTISLIAVYTHGIPMDFPERVLSEVETVKPPEDSDRQDLTDMPFLTIDPADARDHDDAVYAEPDTNPDNEGGWIVWVAIADVAHFVRPGTALDQEARRRGNSCYFPDRVVPMLPDRLSGDLCSLHEDVDRSVMAVRMTFDRHGHKKQHKFVRGLMRSRASMSYEEAQRIIASNDVNAPNAATVLHLWQAYKALEKARAERQPLELDVPEHKIEIDAEGHITKVGLRERFEAHRLIEDFMIAANVCAAETLEKHNTPLLYRVHEPPSDEKLWALQEFLETLDIKLARGQALRTTHLNKILERVEGGDFQSMVNEVMLRSQSQAMYSPENLGHFGLNLQRYAHFTSPIRRYADLIVHRALIRALKLGKDGLTDGEIDELPEVGEEISGHERRAMAAERDSNDRYIAAFLKDRIGATFTGKVTGVTRFGLFVRLDETGADGLVPIRRLPGNEYYHHVETEHALVGEVTGNRYHLGDNVEVRLEEAIPLTGGLLFDVLTPPRPGKKKKFTARRDGKRGRAFKSNRGGKRGKRK
ncbi:MAG: ribonuclease R [Alphaproteobacteria bacterium]|nr:MAG: ribonuclease R [Alphaproteobacteria bacterium]